MDFNAKQIAPPKYWQQFEDICLDVFRNVWKDPTAQKNGRQGQPQAGTDIWGRPVEADSNYWGVQCKGKELLYGTAVTKSELQTEVEKAKHFQPALSHWILATSGPKDAVVEEFARQISLQHQSAGFFSVQVLGWEDIQSLIAAIPSVIERFYPEQAPRAAQVITKLNNIAEQGEVISASLHKKLDALAVTIASDSGLRRCAPA